MYRNLPQPLADPDHQPGSTESGSGPASSTITSNDSSSSLGSGVLLPSGLSTTTSGTIRMNPSCTRNVGTKRPKVRRCLDFSPDAMNVAQDRSKSVTNPAKRFAQGPPDTGRARPTGPNQTPCSSRTAETAHKHGKIMKHSTTTSDKQIRSAVSRSSADPNLIGDYSVPYILPWMNGKHEDLRYISGETVALLLKGEFRQQVASYEIIDCRYPYEFEGGHIRGARNLYTRLQLREGLVLIKRHAEQRPTTITTATRRNILVFHCEYSMVRGPSLLHFLRNYDRNLNKDRYPALHYPEVYLLQGGYQQFFKSYPTLCDPMAYRPMREKAYNDEFLYYKEKFRRENITTQVTR
ncbi:M-phase inducer phosphatase-like [Anopheles bellator]|uniref:M-phase inducer phosphatase-like n=1 Tax=Anopheles bellator TaxID=139047 RepID=UPI00264A3BB2|nr:M-phase inducer phosphatase-like [Anopheles bellator]